MQRYDISYKVPNFFAKNTGIKWQLSELNGAVMPVYNRLFRCKLVSKECQVVDGMIFIFQYHGVSNVRIPVCFIWVLVVLSVGFPLYYLSWDRAGGQLTVSFRINHH